MKGLDWPKDEVVALAERLTRFARRLIFRNPTMEVEDLVQETFSRIVVYEFQKDNTSIWSIAAKTMKHIWLDSHKRPGQFVALDEIPERVCGPVQENCVLVSQLVAAFERLTPDRKRVAFLLLNGDDRNDIKISLGRGEHAVNTLLTNLRNDLRAQGFVDAEEERVRGIAKVSRQYRFAVKGKNGVFIRHEYFPTYSAAVKAKRQIEAARAA